LEGLRGKRKEKKGKVALSLIWLEEGRGEGLIWSKICLVEPNILLSAQIGWKEEKREKDMA